MDLTDIINDAVRNAWIIPALPLFAFFVIVVGINVNAYDNKLISMALTVGSTAIGLLYSVLILMWSLTNSGEHAAHFEKNFMWLKAGDLEFSVGWLIDPIAAAMLMIVTTISLLIQIYTHGYMEKDDGYNRFFAYLALFNFSMLGLVISTNLFQMYIFWELVGVSSYLLIGFWYKRNSAAKAATKAFIMNRIGDFGFLCGIMGLLYFSYDFWVQNDYPLLSFTHLGEAAKIVWAESGRWFFLLICIGLFMGTVAKSAQIPLHTWLPDAMEGPTPISALIHAATMVAAGVYLVARVYPVYVESAYAMDIIAWVGAITAFVAATIAITQSDIKRALAYSTCSQLGYMVMAMGIGAYSAGMFHLLTHAYFKALLFLCSGAIIHGLLDQQNMFYMGGLKKYMPTVRWPYLIATIAITGVLPFSGFFSKDMILTAAFEQNMALFYIGLFTAGMTAFYMFRTYFLTFEGEYRGQVDHPHAPPKVMWIPLVLLAIPSAIIGFTLSGDFGTPSFANSVYFGDHPHEHSFNMMIGGMSLAVALVGFGLAYYLYVINVSLPKKISQNFSSLYDLLVNKWYFDNIYGTFVENFVVAGSKLMALFDKYIIDGIVNLTGYSTLGVGHAAKFTQNGKIQISLAILTILFVFIGLAVFTHVFLGA